MGRNDEMDTYQTPMPITEFFSHYLQDVGDESLMLIEAYIHGLVEYIENLEEELELMDRFANDMEDQAAKLYWLIEDIYEANGDDPTIALLKKKADEIAHQ